MMRLRRTIAGVELMAFSRKQLETILNDTPEKEDVSSLGALEDDPIPLELTVKHQPSKQKHKDFIEVEPWEELEPMPEGEAREMTRQFLYVDGVEIEICTNGNGKHFVRHNVYWWIVFKGKNPVAMFEDFIKNGVKSWYGGEILKEIQSGEYKSKQDDGAHIKLGAWLQHNSLCSLLQANNS